MTVKGYYSKRIRILFPVKGFYIFSIIGFCFITTTCSKPTESEEQQPPDILWTQTFGGSSSEEGHSVQQTLDGGYIITGFTHSYGAGNNDVWLIKTDESGDTVWTRTFGGSQMDWANSVQQTLDGGYIITGFTNSFDIWLRDLWLIKTDESGDTLWTKTFGRGQTDNFLSSRYNPGLLDEGMCVQQTSDGGYIIVGYTESFGEGGYDVWLIKTDESGEPAWTQTFGGSSREEGRSVQQTLDGGYIVTGFTHSYGAGNNDVWLIKTDESGDTVWTRTFGGIDQDEGYFVQQTSDGGYIIVGETYSYETGTHGLSDLWLIKTDALGDTLWTTTHGAYYRDVGSSLQQTSDGGYIITGWSESYVGGSSDVWLIKFDESGNELWTRTFWTPDQDNGYFVQQTSDGGYIITGQTRPFNTYSNVLLIRVAPD